MPHGVGIVGAGPGVSALHLPTLARMPEHFAVVHVADAGSGRAADLAARVGARSSRGTDEILADPRVEVLAICSPPAEHAAQILAAVSAGKRAIFCEKPIGTTVAAAEAAVEACRAAGVALIVGTNHYYDPAWGRARHHLQTSGGPVVSISVTLALPPNGRYHDVVTELPQPLAGRPAPDLSRGDVAAAVVRQLLTGLAIHDLPLVRDLAPVFERVVFARPVAPLGYAVGFVASGIPVQLTTVMLPAGGDALWRLTVTTTSDRLDVTFPPAFVHVGSASVRVVSADGRDTAYAGQAEDGYLAEWRALAQVIEDGVPVEYDELLDDVRYSLRLAEDAAALVEATG
ncbi:Gfo/Idh/MocA family oxidoreductase [Microbacterium sp. CFH 31415]|jgi:predicted dehydrogenase|uniref:Gfo/Idh/MocA family protein n=1 Tax=Microbacterium sp. CFH 31415 TaxID=2921732 RepID=UPI001F146AAB|nr:Gfo/Idh/MocA family oxidoreductase [Microbacterium sp. CFH 31415]MCH6230934.1 Gfo/Idh/MocA family oxidoreductase [Microbacterium sp. CFH 31415]